MKFGTIQTATNPSHGRNYAPNATQSSPFYKSYVVVTSSYTMTILR
jgi:hypothetical protein